MCSQAVALSSCEEGGQRRNGLIERSTVAYLRVCRGMHARVSVCCVCVCVSIHTYMYTFEFMIVCVTCV